MSSIPPPALEKDKEGTTSCKTSTKLTIEDEVLAVAIVVCQTPLFSAKMVGVHGFDVATLLKKGAAMCRAYDGQPITTMEISAFFMESLL